MRNLLLLSLAALSLSAPALAEEWHSADGRDSSRSRSTVDFVDPVALGKFRTVPNSITSAGPIITSGNLLTVQSDSISSDIINCANLVTSTNVFGIRVGSNGTFTNIHQLLGADNFVVAVANFVGTGNGRLRFIPSTTLNGTKVLDINAPIKNAVLHRHTISQKLYIVLQVGNTEIRGFEITPNSGIIQRWSQTIPSHTRVTKPAIVNNKAVYAFFRSGFPNNTLTCSTFDIETGSTTTFDTVTSLIIESSALGIAVDTKRNSVYVHSDKRIRAYSAAGAGAPAFRWNKTILSRRGGIAIAEDSGLLYTQTSGNFQEIDPVNGATLRSTATGTTEGGLGPAISDGSIWMTSANNRLVAVDPVTLSTQRIIAPAGTVFGNYFGVAGIADGHIIALSDLGVEQLSHPRAIGLAQFGVHPTFFYTQDPAEQAANISAGAFDFGILGGVYTASGGANPAALTPLFRLFNSTTGDRLYTADATEKNVALGSGFQSEPDAGFIFTTPGPGKKELRRLVHPGINRHKLVSNSDAIAESVALGFIDEGPRGFVRTQQASPLRRVTLSGSDLAFVSQLEVSSAIASGGTDRGIIGKIFVNREDSPELTPLFRLRNPGTGDIVYTSSASERTAVLALGFTDQGREGYVHSLPGAGRVPLLRALESATGRHLYTTDPAEFQSLSATFTREGNIGFIQK